MATVKEVKLMDGEEQVTPYTLIDSVWYPNGTQFKDNVYTTDVIDKKVKALENAITELNKWVQYMA